MSGLNPSPSSAALRRGHLLPEGEAGLASGRPNGPARSVRARRAGSATRPYRDAARSKWRSDRGDARRRRGRPHVLVGMALELLEIVPEHLDQPPGGFAEFALVPPGAHRIENVRLDARHLLRHRKAEMR